MRACAREGSASSLDECKQEKIPALARRRERNFLEVPNTPCLQAKQASKQESKRSGEGDGDTRDVLSDKDSRLLHLLHASIGE